MARNHQEYFPGACPAGYFGSCDEDRGAAGYDVRPVVMDSSIVGADIFAAQRNGPYRLGRLLFVDARGEALVSADERNADTTQAYGYEEFDRGRRIFLPRRIRGVLQSMLRCKRLPVQRDDVAPDGSDVRILLGLDGGGLAHFELPPGETSIAVSHRTVEEIWFFLNGRGEMWRKLGDEEQIVPVERGVCITIPLGTHFQFRCFGYEPLSAVAVTMPPWPGEGEAYQVHGTWTPTVGSHQPRADC